MWPVNFGNPEVGPQLQGVLRRSRVASSPAVRRACLQDRGRETGLSESGPTRARPLKLTTNAPSVGITRDSEKAAEAGAMTGITSFNPISTPCRTAGEKEYRKLLNLIDLG